MSRLSIIIPCNIFQIFSETKLKKEKLSYKSLKFKKLLELDYLLDFLWKNLLETPVSNWNY